MATAAIQRRPDDGITFKAGQNVTHAVEQALEPVQPLPGLPDHDASTHWLNVSPYPEPEHLLDLQSLGTPCRLLALALTTLAPATTDYALTKYQDAIDWRSVMSRLRSLAQRDGYTWTRQEFYVVDFRSKLMRDIDVDLLFKLDKLSHVEATQSGGLLKYWYGVPDGDRRNLATCEYCTSTRNLPSVIIDSRQGVWRSKQDAINGGTGPWHRQARAIITTMYEEIDVRGVRLTIDDGVGSWSFVPY
ncbi:hypothetical protein LTR92_010474 [Exophiala xenobiotica]|nr:hypothetical protein LTR92_010474 [Exophiala xenobiotica]KAK5529070.1 hypothetical protein LTR23_010816 [Chaetothyriales sp. CCFEE 6169]KAK5212018.1 hypothetical protein LTR41_002260 [Exophiala xenobiotica]KAK5341830.1 hypothetical protein LTR98_002624 [Exophiala xenobiotica]KAK5429786.1 hypothetical protein LTR34_006487 [Exophiala xenobiotica]